MQITPRFGAIIPVIGDDDRVDDVAGRITQKAQQQGLKTHVITQHHGYAPFSSRSPNQRTKGVVILTGKDVDRYETLQQKQIPDYKAKLEAFFQKLYQAVGEPVHERDFHGPTYQYQQYWDQYSQKVKDWVKQNPWPQVPDDSEFHFNVPPHYKQWGEVDNPKSKPFDPVHEVEDRLQKGTLDISG